MLNYFRNWIENAKERNNLNIIESEIINWMQKWFYQYCDEDWEHSGIFKIKTINNPGWSSSIMIEGTHCEYKSFDAIEIKKSKNDWYNCFLKDGRFEGRGGIFNLIDILNIFREWAEKCQKED